MRNEYYQKLYYQQLLMRIYPSRTWFISKLNMSVVTVDMLKDMIIEVGRRKEVSTITHNPYNEIEEEQAYEFYCGYLEASLRIMLEKVEQRELTYEEVRKLQKELDELRRKEGTK